MNVDENYEKIFMKNYEKVCSFYSHTDKGFDDVDKWDIIAGIILAGAMTAIVVGVSVASYYIIVALCNAGVIAFATTLITDKIKQNFTNFLKGEIGWLFEQKLIHTSGEKLKELHHRIKDFLIKHFDNDPKKIKEILVYQETVM